MKAGWLRGSAKLFGVLAVLYFLWVLGTSGGPYQDQLAVLAAIYVILATSVNLLVGYSGLLCLGQQAFFGIGAYTSALLTVNLGLPMPVGVLGGIILASLSGWGLGKITLHLRSAYFVIATLAFGAICRQIALNWVSLTGGPTGLAGIPPAGAGGVSLAKPEALYPVVLAVAAICVLIVTRIARTGLGYGMRAMAENENLARSVGVDTRRHASIAFVVSAGMASVAGSLYAHSVGFIAPSVFSFSVMVKALVMVVGGGLGTVLGPVMGAVFFTELPELLRFSDQWRLVIYGAILVLLVRFLPRGVWGSFATYWARRRNARRERRRANPPGTIPEQEKPKERKPVS